MRVFMRRNQRDLPRRANVGLDKHRAGDYNIIKMKNANYRLWA